MVGSEPRASSSQHKKDDMDESVTPTPPICAPARTAVPLRKTCQTQCCPAWRDSKKSVAEKGEKETKKEEKESEIETTTLVQSLMTYLPKDCLYDI